MNNVYLYQYKTIGVSLFLIGKPLSLFRENLFTGTQTSVIFVSNQNINDHERNIKDYPYPCDIRMDWKRS